MLCRGPVCQGAGAVCAHCRARRQCMHPGMKQTMSHRVDAMLAGPCERLWPHVLHGCRLSMRLRRGDVHSSLRAAHYHCATREEFHIQSHEKESQLSCLRSRIRILNDPSTVLEQSVSDNTTGPSWPLRPCMWIRLRRGSIWGGLLISAVGGLMHLLKSSAAGVPLGDACSWESTAMWAMRVMHRAGGGDGQALGRAVKTCAESSVESCVREVCVATG